MCVCFACRLMHGDQACNLSRVSEQGDLSDQDKMIDTRRAAHMCSLKLVLQSFPLTCRLERTQHHPYTLQAESWTCTRWSNCKHPNQQPHHTQHHTQHHCVHASPPHQAHNRQHAHGFLDAGANRFMKSHLHIRLTKCSMRLASLMRVNTAS